MALLIDQHNLIKLFDKWLKHREAELYAEARFVLKDESEKAKVERARHEVILVKNTLKQLQEGKDIMLSFSHELGGGARE